MRARRRGKERLLVVGSGSELAHAFIEKVTTQYDLVHCDLDDRNVPAYGEFVRLDFTDSARVTELFDVALVGTVTKLVFFAVESAFGAMGTSAATETAQISRNIAAMYNALSAFGTSLKRNKQSGEAVLLSSINADIPVAGFSPYCISKSSIRMLMACAALEFQPYLRINAVAPGPIYKRTGVLAELPGFIAGLEQRHVLERRLARPQDLVPVVEFLLSDAASWIVAQTIVVDGGVSLNWGELQIPA